MRKIKSVATDPSQGGNRPVDIQALKEAILQDKAAGRIPVFVSANFGATGICAIDDLAEIGAFAKQHKIWFNGELRVHFIDTDKTHNTLEGFFGLQVHSGDKSLVTWKNLRIKELN